MRTNLNANFVYSDIENEIIMVGFADDEFNTNEYILIQKALVVNEQDKRLGFDKVHITYSDQQRSAYGGISKFILKKGIAEIKLDPNTAKILNTGEQIQVIFPYDSFILSEVKQKLEQIFKDDIETFVNEI